MEIFENEFISVKIEEENNLYVETWKPTTKEMTEEEWKASRIKLKEIFLQHKPDKLLTLTKEFYFAISPVLQEWMAENVTKIIGHLIKKVALIVPTEIVAELSVGQLMDEKETGQLTSKYFDNEEDARKWIVE